MKTSCTNKEVLQWAIAELGADKRVEAELLLCHVLDTSRALLLAHDTDMITDTNAEAYRALVARRKADEPFQYLTGTASFMGLDFVVTPDVLIPRFDTERLVETCLELLQDTAQPIVLDICTGSGAIAVSISHYRKDAAVYAGDISEAALAIATQNNQRLDSRVSFRQG
ncbi:MAG: peptide chain release factor N(5)-glutamine methyltransferase, partial [Peptococcaceae bacterium]|nr:peptide chain release factor N(5)-glutamine methyltransferase [Peptococcaceae bacterium]